MVWLLSLLYMHSSDVIRPYCYSCHICIAIINYWASNLCRGFCQQVKFSELVTGLLSFLVTV